MRALRVKLLAYLVSILRLGGAIQIARRHIMSQTTSVTAESRPPSFALSSVSLALVVPSPSSPLVFPPDVVRLLEVFARIEARRQARLRSLREREAS